MSHSNSPLSSATSQSEDPSETKTALPAQLSNLQKNTKYVSPYAPVSKQQAKGSTSAETASASSSKTDSKMNSGKNISSADKAKLIKSLETHSVNTLIELRRIEKLLLGNRTADVTKALTNAWAHYVNSNNLLSELRGLTSSYPFSSECLDEAKWMVISDASSSRSWNYCWLVLQKVKNQNLISKHARQMAAKPVMWGGKKPTGAQVEQLAAACTAEWTRALNQLLRHWESPPTM